MNNDRLTDDRVRAAETQFAFPIEMRSAGCVGFNITKVAGVMLSCHWSTVVLMCRIEMSASRRSIGGRAIALFMNVKSMFARRQILDVRDYLHFIAHFRERDRASDLAAGLRFQRRDRLGDVLRVRKGGQSAQRS